MAERPQQRHQFAADHSGRLADQEVHLLRHTSHWGGGGYDISFESGETITIKDGTNGKNGVDGETPDISVKQDADSVYYWTVNGNYLTDASGNKMRVSGAQGEKGAKGIAPQLRISGDNVWQMSTDEGKTWADMTDASGNKVKATGEKGADGRSGSSGTSFFSNVDASQSDHVVFTLSGSGNTEIIVPKVSDGVVIRLPYSVYVLSENIASDAKTIGFTLGDASSVTLENVSKDNIKAVYAEMKSEKGSNTLVITPGNTESSIEGNLDVPSVAVLRADNDDDDDDDDDDDFTRFVITTGGFALNDKVPAILKVSVLTNDGNVTSASMVIKWASKPAFDESTNTYTVKTADEWIWLTENYDGVVGEGENVIYNDRKIVLANDIDFGGIEIMPLGGETDFYGTFDGQNHTLSNFKIMMGPEVSSTGVSVGLFGTVTCNQNDPNKHSSISNLKIEKAEVRGFYTVGIVAGNVMMSDISNVSVKNSTVTIPSWEIPGTSGGMATLAQFKLVGGICGGSINSTIENCTVENCTLTGFSDEDGKYIFSGMHTVGINAIDGMNPELNTQNGNKVINVTIHATPAPYK